MCTTPNLSIDSVASQLADNNNINIYNINIYNINIYNINIYNINIYNINNNNINIGNIDDVVLDHLKMFLTFENP